MKRFQSKLGRGIAIVYIIVFVLIFYPILFISGENIGRGVFSAILTYPWSLLIVILGRLFGFQNYLSSFGIAAISIAAAVNAYLLYLIGAGIQKLWRKRRQPSQTPPQSTPSSSWFCILSEHASFFAAELTFIGKVATAFLLS